MKQIRSIQKRYQKYQSYKSSLLWIQKHITLTNYGDSIYRDRFSHKWRLLMSWSVYQLAKYNPIRYCIKINSESVIKAENVLIVYLRNATNIKNTYFCAHSGPSVYASQYVYVLFTYEPYINCEIDKYHLSPEQANENIPLKQLLYQTTSPTQIDGHPGLIIIINYLPIPANEI